MFWYHSNLRYLEVLLLLYINRIWTVSPQTSQRFHIIEGLHVVGFSPELLSNFLSDFADCGTFHTRLTHFSQPLVLNSVYKDGLVFQAFISAIRKVLKYFTAEVLNAPEDLQLMQLKVYFHRSISHIRWSTSLLIYIFSLAALGISLDYDSQCYHRKYVL